MFITQLKLKHFRCFENKEFEFDKKVVVVEGNNGAGKTSLLEALYYSCYLKSFRTRSKKDLLLFNKEHFFINVGFDESIADCKSNIQIGFSGKEGRLVKFNKKPIDSYKEIISHFKVVSLNEDDLQIVVGAPEFRRAFLNQSLFLIDPDFVKSMKNYKQVLQQRNVFILKNSNRSGQQSVRDQLLGWTKQLWEKTVDLQKKRINLLSTFEKEVNCLFKSYFQLDEQISIKINYSSKNTFSQDDFISFWEKYQAELLEKEFRWGRTLFGAHLDDFSINFRKKLARVFASRGQQKLVLFLLKVSQLKVLQKEKEPGVLLLDDFLTDFDVERLKGSFLLLKDLGIQVFITSPLKSFLYSKLDPSLLEHYQFLNL